MAGCVLREKTMQIKTGGRPHAVTTNMESGIRRATPTNTRFHFCRMQKGGREGQSMDGPRRSRTYSLCWWLSP